MNSTPTSHLFEVILFCKSFIRRRTFQDKSLNARLVETVHLKTELGFLQKIFFFSQKIGC